MNPRKLKDYHAEKQQLETLPTYARLGAIQTLEDLKFYIDGGGKAISLANFHALIGGKKAKEIARIKEDYVKIGSLVPVVKDTGAPSEATELAIPQFQDKPPPTDKQRLVKLLAKASHIDVLAPKSMIRSPRIGTFAQALAASGLSEDEQQEYADAYNEIAKEYNEGTRPRQPLDVCPIFHPDGTGVAYNSFRVFWPRFKNETVDVEYIQRVGGALLEAGQDRLAETMVEQFNLVSRSWYMGNGTIEGLIERQERLAVVRAETLVGYQPVNRKNFLAWLAKRSPLGEPILMGSHNTVAAFQAQALVHGHKIGHIQLGSSAGLVYGDATAIKNANVLVQSRFLADLLLNECAASLEESDTRVGPRGFDWRPWRPILLVAMKAKAEPTKLANIDKKVRGIAAGNFPANLPASLIVEAAQVNRVGYPANRESRSMKGFTPYKGGMQALMLAARADLHAMSVRLGKPVEAVALILTYADNVTQFTTRGVASGDGEVFEATLREATLAVTRERFAAQIGLTGPFLAYWNEVYPQLVLGTYATLGNQQFKVQGMGSGVIGTFENNDDNMQQVPYYMERAFGGGPVINHGSGEVSYNGAVATLKAGIRLKVESTSDWPQDHAGLFKVDILGHDAYTISTPVSGQLMTLGILQYPRIMRLLAFSKLDYFRDVSELTSAEVATYRFLKFRLAYLIGGFAYPGLAEWIIVSIIMYHEMLKEYAPGVIDQVLEEYNEVATESEYELFQPEVIRSATLSDGVPTLWEALTFSGGSDFADVYVREAMTLPAGKLAARTLAPPAVWQRFAPGVLDKDVPLGQRDVPMVLSVEDAPFPIVYFPAGGVRTSEEAEPLPVPTFTKDPSADIMRGMLGSHEKWEEMDPEEKAASRALAVAVVKIFNASMPQTVPVVVDVKGGLPFAAGAARLASISGTPYVAIKEALKSEARPAGPTLFKATSDRKQVAAMWKPVTDILLSDRRARGNLERVLEPLAAHLGTQPDDVLRRVLQSEEVVPVGSEFEPGPITGMDWSEVVDILSALGKMSPLARQGRLPEPAAVAEEEQASLEDL